MLDVYRQVASRVATPEAMALATELRAWHDAMVSHQRSLARLGRDRHACAELDECAHGLARDLWKQAVAILGPHAEELTFLRECAGVTEVQDA